MKIKDYRELVQKHGGIAFGNTDQGGFITSVNRHHKGTTTHFLESFSSSLLKRPVAFKPNLLQQNGVCDGLVQTFYQAVQLSNNTLDAIANFANQLDASDEALARKAAALQSFTSENYDNLEHYISYKSLGLDLVSEETFNPFINEKLQQKFQAIVANFEEVFKKLNENQSNISPSKNTEKTKDTDAILQEMANKICIQPDGDLTKICLDFYLNESKIFDEALNGHAIGIFKLNDNQGKKCFVFYDPNGLPTVFDDEQNFKKFLIQYFTIISNELKFYLNADYVQFTTGRYSSATNEFHELMRNTEKELLAKIKQYQILPNKNDEFLMQLQILAKKCELADRYSEYYRPKEKDNSSLKTSPDFFGIFQKIDSNRKRFYSTNELCALIKKDIAALKNDDPSFIEKLLEKFNVDDNSNDNNNINQNISNFKA